MLDLTLQVSVMRDLMSIFQQNKPDRWSRTLDILRPYKDETVLLEGVVVPYVLAQFRGDTSPRELKERLWDSPICLLATHLKMIKSLDAQAVQNLAASPYTRNLTHLKLSVNYMGPDGASCLAQSPHFKSLTYLDLESNALGDEGLAKLAESESFRKVSHLVLVLNNLTGESLRSLAGFTNLKHLDLSHNDIDDQGIAHLNTLGLLDQLTHLGLGVNKINDKGATLLYQNLDIFNLQCLDLGCNNISVELESTILACSNLTALRRPLSKG